GLLVLNQAADFERVVVAVDLRRVLDRIVGVERERTRDRALRIGRREPVRIEQPALYAIVEIGNLHERVLGRGLIDDVAAGQESERAEARAATQEQPARRVGHQLGGVLYQELGVETGSADAGHERPPTVR